MFTFNKTTGTYNVEFGNVNVPQKSKLKMKQLLPDDQDPIFLVPLPFIKCYTGLIGLFYSP
jgi:hypothetical protein